MSKISKILVFINVGLLTFFLNMADISSSSQVISEINNYILPRANGLPSTLFENTNPIKIKSLTRGLASDKSDLDKKDKTEEKKPVEEETESYSLLDPNLYEDGSDGASDILQINQINNQLSQ